MGAHFWAAAVSTAGSFVQSHEALLDRAFHWSWKFQKSMKMRTMVAKPLLPPSAFET